MAEDKAETERKAAEFERASREAAEKMQREWEKQNER